MFKAKDRSFKEFISSRFYNELWDSVETFLEENCGGLALPSRSIHEVDAVEFSDTNIMEVIIEDKPAMEIAFDLLVEAGFEISEIDRRVDRFDEKVWFEFSQLWFLIMTSAIVNAL